MNILILHNIYKQPGGEDAVVAAEADMLRSGQHAVHVKTVSNDAIQSLGDKIRTFWRTSHDPARKQWKQKLINFYEPEVIHVHNFFPLLTPVVHEAASEAGVAVVQTLHNYRLFCAGALLLRKNKICEKCLQTIPLWGVVHRCYRGSLAGSLAVVRMQMCAAQKQTWLRHVHRFIALTHFARQKFIQAGLPAERIMVKPNFVAEMTNAPTAERRGAIFVGRLSAEKGVHVLLEAWKQLPKTPLTIVGDGPERPRLEALAPPGVTFLGRLPSSDVHAQMLQAQILIMPSLWYEGLPMTLIEAYAAGLPVIASRLGALEELVFDGKTGFHFPPGDAKTLADTIHHALSNPAQLAAMGRTATQTCEARYTAKQNLPMLERVYQEAISAKKHEII